MTVEEAKALVLEEGMVTEPWPDNAMAIILHSGMEPDKQHIEALMKALEAVSHSLKGKALLNKKLAAALYVLGVEASTYLGHSARKNSSGDAVGFEKVLGLRMAVENIFLGD